jgi:hypothetical protein
MVSRPFGVFAAVTNPTLAISAVMSIRFAKATNLLVAFTVHDISRYPNTIAVSINLDVYAAMLLPLTMRDLSVFVPTLHQDLRNERKVKA